MLFIRCRFHASSGALFLRYYSKMSQMPSEELMYLQLFYFILFLGSLQSSLVDIPLKNYYRYVIPTMVLVMYFVV